MEKKRAARGRPRSFDREDALDRAMRVFWDRGYEATTVGDLTAAMGISPPSLYAAFGDKERLFLEAADRYRAGPGAAGDRILAEASTAREAVSRLLRWVADSAAAPGHPPGCMMVTAAVNCTASSGRVQAALAARRAAAEAALRARIARGIREGDLRRGADPSALAAFYTTVVQGMSIRARDGAGRASLRRTAAAAMRAWPV